MDAIRQTTNITRISAIDLLDAGVLMNRAVVVIPQNTLATIHYACSVGILRRIVVNTRDQRLRVKHCEMCAGIAIRNFHFAWRQVLENVVHAGGVLTHRICNIRVVVRFVGQYWLAPTPW